MTESQRVAGTHPRPQLTRTRHAMLDVESGFAFDPHDRGLRDGWMHSSEPFDRRILLPFSPESPASGIGDTGFHPLVWYRLEFGADELAAAGFSSQGDRLLLHFGAVDRVAEVWVDGVHVGGHEGGYTAFSFDVTEALDASIDDHIITVRAFDDPVDLESARGKQDWQRDQHSIWYHRMTGIWRSVWLEAVPSCHVTSLVWTADPGRTSATIEIELNRAPSEGAKVRVAVVDPAGRAADTEVAVTSDRVIVDVALDSLRNPQTPEEILWSPDRPNLIDAVITLSRDGVEQDRVESYFGVRSIAVADRRLLLNDRPFTVRAVLEQGYWPETHYTPPSTDAIRDEVELIKSLGFNSVRIHQKTEDPRFLYWCDRLGLAVWSEAPAAYEFNARAAERFTRGWLDIMRGLISHPSIIIWVPFNESWGVQQLSTSAQQTAFVVALTELTRSIDPSRLVISNDGWEHRGSDLATIHDYESSPEVLAGRYADESAVDALLSGMGPAGRRMGDGVVGKPAVLSEFGGVSLGDGGWGYSAASDPIGYERHLAGLLGAVARARGLIGFCYTQLTDTGLEINGLCRADRTPKIAAETIRSLVLGE